MNGLQKQLFTVICALMQSDGFSETVKNGAIRYGFLNYIAKYSLAKDRYSVTPAAKKHLETNRFVIDRGLRRGLKSKRNGFTYEHPIPANVVADELLSKLDDLGHAKRVLEWADMVTVLTIEEDQRLSGILRSKMPHDWRYFDSDRYARYAHANIDTNECLKEIPVFGAIKR